MSSSDNFLAAMLNLAKPDDSLTIQQIFDNFWALLVNVAHRKLRGGRYALADAEDIAASAFRSFLRRAPQGDFPKLKDRKDLRQVLIMIAAQKAAHLHRDQSRIKRGGHMTRADADLRQIPGKQFAADVADNMEHLLGLLQHDKLRQVAVLKFERYQNQQIAKKLDCSLSSVERALATIRRIWESEAPQ